MINLCEDHAFQVKGSSWGGKWQKGDCPSGKYESLNRGAEIVGLGVLSLKETSYREASDEAGAVCWGMTLCQQGRKVIGAEGDAKKLNQGPD